MTVLLLPIVHLKHFVHFHTNTHTIRAELLRQLLENIITKVSNPTKVLKTDFVKARVSDTLDTMTSPQSSPPPNPTMTSLPNSRTSPPPNPTQLRVLRQLYTHSPLTKQDIAIQLGLSLPTVTSALRALEHNCTVVRATPRASTGGRRPATYSFNMRRHVALGVTIRSTEIVCIAVDLSGAIVDQWHTTIAARAEAIFYQRAAHIIEDFAHALSANGLTPLGTGLTVPAHVNAANSLDYERIGANSAPPVTFTERYCAYALAEHWARPHRHDAVCLFLGNHIGSAVIVNGTPHTGAIEHMQLVPGGPQCECGSTGCLNVYCASNRLAEEGESLPGFFGVLEQGEIHHRERMRAWLESLGHAIANVHTVFDADVVLCGPIAGYLDDAEIAQLQQICAARPTAARRIPNYSGSPRIIRGLCDKYQDATGAALAVVQAHLAVLGCV